MSYIFMPYFAFLHTLALIAVRAAVRTELYYRKDMIQFQSFNLQVTKIKVMTKLLWPLLMVNNVQKSEFNLTKNMQQTCLLNAKHLPTIMTFLLRYICNWRQDNWVVFACWVLIGRFKFRLHKPSARQFKSNIPLNSKKKTKTFLYY